MRLFGVISSALAALVNVVRGSTPHVAPAYKYQGAPVPLRRGVPAAINHRYRVFHANGKGANKTKGRKDASLKIRSNRRKAAR